MAPITSRNPHDRDAAAAAASFTVFAESSMLARIGNDLRDLYGKVADAPRPGDLLQRANLIDGKRRHGAEDRATT